HARVRQLGSRGAERADQVLEAGLRLAAGEGLRPELGAAEERLRHLAQIPGRPHEDVRETGDERFGRIVGDEALRELARDEERRGGMRVEVVEQPLDVALTPTAPDRQPENLLRAVIVVTRAVLVVAARPDVVDPVPGEAARG